MTIFKAPANKKLGAFRNFANRHLMLFLGVSEMVARGTSWLTMAALPLIISSSLYGTISVVWSALMSILPLFLMGQDREVLSSASGLESDEFKKSLVVCFWVSLFSLFLCMLVLLFLRENHWFLLLVPISAFFLASNRLFLCVFRCRREFNRYIRNRLAYSVARFFVVIVLVSTISNVEIYILAEALAALLVTSGVACAFPWSRVFNVDIGKRLIRGVPIAMHGVFGMLLSVSDRFVLTAYVSPSEVGSYSMAYIYASALTFVFAVFAIIHEPIIYRASTENELVDSGRKCRSLMLLYGAAVSVFLVVFYKFATRFSVGYSADYGVFVVLLLAHMVMPFYLVANYSIVRLGAGKYLMYGSFLAVVINNFFNICFIPVFGVWAAAASTLVSNVFLVAFVHGVFVRRVQQYDWGK